MSHLIEGLVGSKQVAWSSVPRGRKGASQVEVDGEKVEVTWQVDEQGIWIELPNGTFGFDLRGTEEDGVVLYDLLERGGHRVYRNLSFARKGELSVGSGSTSKKKVQKIKADMPGKIVRLNVAEGDQVEKGQPLLVMEAMKMENEIRSPGDGVVKFIRVKEGQAVESGAELIQLGDQSE